MALTSRRSADVEAKIAALMAQRDAAEAQQRNQDETRRNVERCERKFGIPSECIHQAIDNGTLEETLEVVEWIFDYNLLCRAGER
jgi:hypothetical protein